MISSEVSSCAAPASSVVRCLRRSWYCLMVSSSISWNFFAAIWFVLLYSKICLRSIFTSNSSLDAGILTSDNFSKYSERVSSCPPRPCGHFFFPCFPFLIFSRSHTLMSSLSDIHSPSIFTAGSSCRRMSLRTVRSLRFMCAHISFIPTSCITPPSVRQRRVLPLPRLPVCAKGSASRWNVQRPYTGTGSRTSDCPCAAASIRACPSPAPAVPP